MGRANRCKLGTNDSLTVRDVFWDPRDSGVRIAGIVGRRGRKKARWGSMECIAVSMGVFEPNGSADCMIVWVLVCLRRLHWF